VAPYVKMQVQMLRSSNPKNSEDWIAREHRDNFGSWLHLQIMDQDVGVQLVDMNPDDIEILQILASEPSTMIHPYTSYDINGFTFYTRAQDNRKTNQNSGVQIDAYNYDGNRETYYRLIEEIWELECRENLKVPLFHPALGCLATADADHDVKVRPLPHLRHRRAHRLQIPPLIWQQRKSS
jgi:hypothetical protein